MDKKQDLYIDYFVEKYRALGEMSSLREKAKRLGNRPTLFRQWLKKSFPGGIFHGTTLEFYVPETQSAFIIFCNYWIGVFKSEIEQVCSRR